MREVLFRGKMSDSEKWVFGYYCSFKGSADIFVPFTEEEEKANEGHIFSAVGGLWYSVRSETVGQFTGLTDKNGKKIFEGDVVRQTFEKSIPFYASSWGSDEYEDICGEDVGAVVIIPSKGVCIKNPIIHREVDGEITEHGKKSKMYKPVCSGRCEVIGNIHDNPELLEGFNG